MFKRIVYLGIIIFGVYLIINLSSTIARLWQRQEEVTRAQQKLITLKKENKDLEMQLEEIQSPQFFERQVREKLNLVLPGEKQVFIEEGLLKATESSKTAQPQNFWVNWEKWLKLFF